MAHLRPQLPICEAERLPRLGVERATVTGASVRLSVTTLLAVALLVTGCAAAATPRATGILAEQDGSGTLRLAPFTASAGYRVDLRYACSPTVSALSVTAYGPTGSVLETLLTMAPVTGSSVTTYGTVSGSVVLEVGSINCTWHVRVSG